VLDHLRRGTFSAATVRVLVLDESDEMLSMGFLPQINEILSFLPESRQTLLFSATLPPDIQRMASERLKQPEFLTLSGDHVGALEIQHFVYLSFGDKVSELIKIIETENPESAIVFCNTREETKRVAAALEQQGYSADWLNADLAQTDREKVMDATRKGELRFLVATDVAARGIDISHLTHVINYDFPESAEGYVHRTGRTGRAGRTGTAISLIEPGDVGNLYLLRLTYKLRPVEKQLPSAREMKTRAEADLVGLFVGLFGERQHHADDLALARRLLSHESAELVVAGLLRDHLGARPEAQDEATAQRRARTVAVREAAPSRPEREPRQSPQREPRQSPEPEREHRSDADVEQPPPRGLDEREPSQRRQREPCERKESAPRDRRERRRSSERELFHYTVEGDDEGSERASAADIAAPGPVENGAADAERTPADLAEVYVNVGRRDGAEPGDFHAVLRDRAGLGPDATDYVRVRHRHSFVGTRKELLERVLQALDGATIAGKTAVAEIARPRA
jgi:ATP-dependent RNA helicase DeaD